MTTERNDYLLVAGTVDLMEQAAYMLEDHYEGLESDERRKDLEELLDAMYATLAECRAALKRWADEMGEPF